MTAENGSAPLWPHATRPSVGVPVITPENAFFLKARRTAQEYFFKGLFSEPKATMNDGRVELAAVRQHLRPGSVIVDVGAHVGVFSRRFAALAPDCTVVAFEPQSLPRAVFSMVGFFRNKRNILVMPLALGADAGLIELSIPIKRKGAVGIGLAHVGDDADLKDRFDVRKELVAIARLDDVLARMDLGPVSLIKIDVEGGELGVLRGATQTLETHGPAVLCEIDGREHRFGDQSDALGAFLQALGYAPFSLETGAALPMDGLEKNTLFLKGST
ncbi:MAG: FkbM family methyltransferase [Pseudomonadota bacterium]